ncbi:HAD family hydrolase [Jonesiaceae bacterium BS-20]|uniref:HAD family hydrolase n=1 Tax=Jonesiaceae bacterium BS-20 TaxID=3120821 RepID=A0AAU7DVK1_9MICO
MNLQASSGFSQSRLDAPALSVANARTATKLVGLDIDGTIMTADGFISEAVREHITQLSRDGHHVVLSTGRPLVALLPVLEELKISQGWAVGSNGSVTIQLDQQLPGGYQIEHSVLFSARDAVTALAQYMPDAVIGLENIGRGYYINEDFGNSKLSGEHTVHSLAELQQMQTTRVVVARADHAAKEFSAAVAKLGLRDTYYSVADVHWMDLAPEGMTKAYALERLRKKLGVLKQETVAVGDAENDIEMLAWAHRGVAMGNSDAAVVAAANEVTYGIGDDGLEPILASLRSN